MRLLLDRETWLFGTGELKFRECVVNFRGRPAVDLELKDEGEDEKNGSGDSILGNDVHDGEDDSVASDEESGSDGGCERPLNLNEVERPRDELAVLGRCEHFFMSCCCGSNLYAIWLVVVNGRP